MINNNTTITTPTAIVRRDRAYTGLRTVTTPVLAISARQCDLHDSPRPPLRMLHCTKYFSRALVCLNTTEVRVLTATFTASSCLAARQEPSPHLHSWSNSTQLVTPLTLLSTVITRRSRRIFTFFTSSRASREHRLQRLPAVVCTVFFTDCSEVWGVAKELAWPKQYTS